MLTNENYFSEEMNYLYSGSSQFKDFFGTMVKSSGCEERAVKTLLGEWKKEMGTALLVGSYVDSYFEGGLELFKAHHPEIFLKNGGLKADFRKAEEIIDFLEKDELFMKYLSGEKQVIMTGEIEGVGFKIKIDSFLKNKAIVDLKVMASITKKEWVKDFGRVGFVDLWGYDIQGAIYQEIVRQNTGEKLPFFIAGVTKERYPNKEIIYIDDEHLEYCLDFVKENAERLSRLKNAEEKPTRCENCDYCRHTKVLTHAVHYRDIKEG